jgi:UDPglucose 6-dehydrogenase
VYDVAIALGMDKRIGPKFLHPGPGYGGSCFPKDVKGLVNIALDNNYEFKLVETVIQVNARQRQIIVDRVLQILGEVADKNITILGLAFKPNTDDTREAPAIHIARALLALNAKLTAHDPAAMDEARKELPNINYVDNPYDACKNSDLVMIITEWNEFRDLDLERVKQLVRLPNLFDTRNLYDPNHVKSLGFNYFSTGRNAAV